MSNKLIGIIDFNPDIHPDTRQYVRRIGSLIPQNQFEGIHFGEDRDLSRYVGLILSGSKLSATQYQSMMDEERTLNEDYLRINQMRLKLSEFKGPMFGICFGAQLIAYMMGGRLGSLPHTEAGYLEHELTDDGKKDKIFGKLPHVFHGAHLHKDFVESLPKDDIGTSKILAVRNGYIHAYSLTLRDGIFRYGVQPHPEMSNPQDAVLLVKLNSERLIKERGLGECKKALALPENPNFNFAGVVKGFVDMINPD